MNPSTLVLHVLGGTLGGLMSGIALGVLGIATRFLTPRFSSLSGLLVSLALVVAGLFDMGLLHDYTNRLTRQTPGSWICSLGPKGALFSWAFDVGTGVTTRLPLTGVGALLPLCVVLFKSIGLGRGNGSIWLNTSSWGGDSRFAISKQI